VAAWAKGTWEEAAWEEGFSYIPLAVIGRPLPGVSPAQQCRG
jgi:hypothetical protein